MGSNHFDEAFVKHINNNIEVDKIKKLCLGNPIQFERFYSNDLYCPECMQAKLKFVNGSKKYLRTYKNFTHKGDCSHSPFVNIASTEQIEEYIKTIDPQIRENKLLKLLSFLNFDKNETTAKITSKPIESCFTFVPKNGIAKRVCITRQRLKNDNNEFEYGVYKYYYGNTYLEVDKKHLETFKNIQFRLYTFQNNIKSKGICSIFLSGEVLHSPIINTENGINNIAFFGKMIQKGIYNNLYINTKYDIIFKPYV